MDASLSPVWIAAIVVGWCVAFALIWSGVVALLGALSGWRALAARYADPTPPARYAHAGVSGSLRGVAYRHVLRVQLDATALHLAVHPLFRIGHPPLRIPRSALQRGDSGSFFGRRYVRLRIGTPVRVELVLPDTVLEGLV